MYIGDTEKIDAENRIEYSSIGSAATCPNDVGENVLSQPKKRVRVLAAPPNPPNPVIAIPTSSRKSSPVSTFIQPPPLSLTKPTKTKTPTLMHASRWLKLKFRLGDFKGNSMLEEHSGIVGIYLRDTMNFFRGIKLSMNAVPKESFKCKLTHSAYSTFTKSAGSEFGEISFLDAMYFQFETVEGLEIALMRTGESLTAKFSGWESSSPLQGTCDVVCELTPVPTCDMVWVHAFGTALVALEGFVEEGLIGYLPAPLKIKGPVFSPSLLQCHPSLISLTKLHDKLLENVLKPLLTRNDAQFRNQTPTNALYLQDLHSVFTSHLKRPGSRSNLDAVDSCDENAPSSMECMESLLCIIESLPFLTESTCRSGLGSSLLFEHMTEKESLPFPAKAEIDLKSCVPLRNLNRDALERLNEFFLLMVRVRSNCIDELSCSCSGTVNKSVDMALIDVCSRSLLVIRHLFDIYVGDCME